MCINSKVRTLGSTPHLNGYWSSKRVVGDGCASCRNSVTAVVVGRRISVVEQGLACWLLLDLLTGGGATEGGNNEKKLGRGVWGKRQHKSKGETFTLHRGSPSPQGMIAGDERTRGKGKLESLVVVTSLCSPRTREGGRLSVRGSDRSVATVAEARCCGVPELDQSRAALSCVLDRWRRGSAACSRLQLALCEGKMEEWGNKRERVGKGGVGLAHVEFPDKTPAISAGSRSSARGVAWSACSDDELREGDGTGSASSR